MEPWPLSVVEGPQEGKAALAGGRGLLLTLNFVTYWVFTSRAHARTVSTHTHSAVPSSSHIHHVHELQEGTSCHPDMKKTLMFMLVELAPTCQSKTRP